MNEVISPVAPPSVAARRRFSPWVVVLTIFTVLFVFVAIWFQRHAGDGSGFAYYGQWIGKDAPDFALTNQDCERTQLSSLRGNVVLLTFGFTHCPNICPTTLANLAAIRNGLPPREQDRMKVVFVSVDPERDTPKVMKDYIGFYSKGFLGLTGPPDDIARVAKAYNVYYQPVMQQSQVASEYYTIDHSAYVYLVDQQGRFALLYDNDKLTDHARMTQDIEHILAGGN